MDVWTTNDLAKAAGVTPQFIRQEIWAGNIECQKVGRDWAIPAEEARRWLAERRGESQTPPVEE
jgi:hypothetical protein